MQAERARGPAALAPAARRPLAEFGDRVRLLGPALNARLQLRGADSLGARVTLRGRARIVNEGTLIVGDRVRLDSTITTLELVTLPSGRMGIGDDVFINHGSSLAAGGLVKIGNDYLLGADVMIMDCDSHRVEDKKPWRRGFSRC